MIGQQSLMTAQHATLSASEEFRALIFGDIVVTTALAFIVLWLVMFVSALVGVLRSPMTPGMKLVWTVASFAAPVLGPLVWFMFGRRDAYRRLPTH